MNSFFPLLVYSYLFSLSSPFFLATDVILTILMIFCVSVVLPVLGVQGLIRLLPREKFSQFFKQYQEVDTSDSLKLYGGTKHFHEMA